MGCKGRLGAAPIVVFIPDMIFMLRVMMLLVAMMARIMMLI